MIYKASLERFLPYMDAEDVAQLREYPCVSAMWNDCVVRYADRVAIEDNGNSYTYRQLESAAAVLRGALAEAGCSHGIRVGLLAENSVDFAIAFLAITTLGGVAAVLPAHLPAQAVLGCSMQFGLKLLVCTPTKRADCTLAEEKLGLPILQTDAAGKDPCPASDCQPAEPCAIVFTGGTTGKSKGALLSNGAVMQGTFNGLLGVRHVFNSRYLLCLPLSHVFGLIRNLMTSLCSGSTLFICRNNQDLFRDIAVFRPTTLVLVPALAEMALALSKKFRRNMLGEDLKSIICGAAAVPPYLITEYQKLGISLYAGYGLTESANLVSGNPENLARPESVGLPYPNQELRIVDGELWLRGKNIMDGYVGNDEPAFTEDGWFRTGDLVRMDEDGFLYIAGRSKEIIVLPSGENISPAELEAHYLECTLIQDCQVFEDITDNGRHILALEVVPRAAEMAKLPQEEAPRILMAQLSQINEQFPPFQRVSRITVRDKDFERTKSMKIVRYKKCK